MSMSRHTISFNCMLSREESIWLLDLAKLRQVSQAQILRDALRAKYTMEIAYQPSCANGTRCLVPQMHVPPPAAPNA